ncbi:recombination protein F [Qipengyuania algicida]|nr:recombination protein F [Qipengyuania algicida]
MFEFSTDKLLAAAFSLVMTGLILATTIVPASPNGIFA